MNKFHNLIKQNGRSKKEEASNRNENGNVVVLFVFNLQFFEILLYLFRVFGWRRLWATKDMRQSSIYAREKNCVLCKVPEQIPPMFEKFISRRFSIHILTHLSDL